MYYARGGRPVGSLTEELRTLSVTRPNGRYGRTTATRPIIADVHSLAVDVTTSIVSISPSRHSHMTRRMPRCYSYAPCPIEMGAAPPASSHTVPPRRPADRNQRWNQWACLGITDDLSKAQKSGFRPLFDCKLLQLLTTSIYSCQESA